MGNSKSQPGNSVRAMPPEVTPGEGRPCACHNGPRQGGALGGGGAKVLDSIRAMAVQKDATEIRAEIKRLCTIHEAQIANWIEADGAYTRPEPPAELADLEHRLCEIAGAARTAERDFPIASGNYSEAV